ncbi:MAG: putative dehydrogenase/threonine dehydrogenase-like Zn-dependent dehydrogenase [Candidatus Azotimanducaceae bacterium]|jgi:predicted dehydrogenase/threonine dehydrogenase-like Zn-dependent dehydrogenase
MKQVLQDLKSGDTILEEIPSPSVASGSMLIQTTHTLVSAGTERMLVDFGRGNLIQKARQQPDKVKQVLEKVQTDGLMPTIDAVKNKLDTPLPLGYCNVGRVLESRANEFAIGERVVSNGKHAEIVCVPKNLCAAIPDAVDDESAAFTVIGAIALQGIRLIKPTLGETVVVTGLGLIGLVAVQLLRAHGCRVLGIDFDPAKLALAKQFGAEVVNLAEGQDPLAVAEKYSRGRGVDAVLITASTKSNEPIHQAALMSRQRGRIVLVGVVGMEMSRADFYEKELSFQVSCSYGPGRYDVEYEDKGNDYPLGFVRWTEQRNFEAILDMMADGRIDMKPLISHRFSLADAGAAYDVVSNGNPLGVMLAYEQASPASLTRQTISLSKSSASPSAPVIGFIGAGNYASSVLVPAFKATSARLKSIASAGGVSSVHVGKKHGIEEATTDTEALLVDAEVNALVISTRHNSHARWVRAGLENGKHIFVEKPLTLTRDELTDLVSYIETIEAPPIVMVGFNRRYAPHVQIIKKQLASKTQAKSLVMTINAGAIPADHWTQDRDVGGGRIIGEGCHFIDLLRYLVGSPILSVQATAMDSRCSDTVMIQLTFQDGSIGSINYLANGSKAFPKERLEVFCGGAILQLDNFRALKSYGWAGVKSQRLWRQDKGQKHCANAFVEAIQKGDTTALIPMDELVEVANVCFDVMDQINA